MLGVQPRKSIHRESKTPIRTVETAQHSDADYSEEPYSSSEENEIEVESAGIGPDRSPEKQIHYENKNIDIIASHRANSKKYLCALTVFIAAALSVLFLRNTDSLRNCSYHELQQLYPQQHDSVWRILSVGIQNILNKRTEMPGVYLFVHQGDNSVHKLIKEIVAKSSYCFGQTTPVEMRSDDFISEDNDYGHAIENYKMKIKQGPVILITNLNEIPAEAARALHTICDTHSPIEKDVIIFLTLVTPVIDENHLKNTEDTLVKLWGSKLDRTELDPLITRLTDQVIPLRS